MIDNLPQLALLVSLMAATIRIATPLLLAALGELITERAGVMNLGVEGMMLMGAFSSFLFVSGTESLLAGLLGGVLAGLVTSLIMAILVITLKVDQTLSGLSINLLASGLTFYAYRVIFPRLSASGTSDIPKIDIMRAMPIPYLSRIPIVGEVFFSQHTLSYIALILVPLVWIFLYKTKYGLIIRSVGENPKAIDTRGLSVTGYRYATVLFGGAMAGLAGSFLTLVSSGLFSDGITAGRGWLAIIIVIAGNWQPFRIFLASTFLALFEAIQLQVQGVGINLPFQLLNALPYILAIVLLAIGKARSAAPEALGTPYLREETTR